MTPRLVWALLAAAAVLGALALAVAIGRGRSEGGGRGGAARDDAAENGGGEAQRVSVELYFPGPDGRLVREPREVEYSADPSTFATRIVEGVLAGPAAEPPFRPFPPDVTIGDVQVDEDGTAYVDLRSTEHPTPPFAGSTAEMLALYSLVNSVVENVDGAHALVVLWNGRQPRTFGGHIDTTRPLQPALDLGAS